MDVREASVWKLSRTHGFGAMFWIICPVCWNAMRVTFWEDGSTEEECPSCQRIDRLMILQDSLGRA